MDNDETQIFPIGENEPEPDPTHDQNEIEYLESFKERWVDIFTSFLIGSIVVAFGLGVAAVILTVFAKLIIWLAGR